jgi:hydroxymethylpyrimidine/phosphomethylpyrimidine kinase
MSIAFRVPNVLSVAGSDPSGGAGIQADLKTFSALQVYGMAAVTALTAQNTRGVSAIHVPPPDHVGAQVRDVLADVRVDSVKVGMIANAAVASAVSEALTGLAAPIVLDPVMVAKGGHRLLEPDAVAALREKLLPLAAVITPNLEESAALLSQPLAVDRRAMERQAAMLRALGAQAVLLKGGHLTDAADSPDLLLWADGSLWLEGARTRTRATHGTGCTLSSALAARLAHGDALPDAARAAKEYVSGAIAAAGRLTVGSGHGPTHHFHASWPGAHARPSLAPQDGPGSNSALDASLP